MNLNTVFQIYFSIINFSLANSVSVANAQTVLDTEPKLITEGQVDIPVSVLKKGQEGTVELLLSIDQFGSVENCTITAGSIPLLDSIAKHSVMRSIFSPAIENGIVVPSILKIQTTFITDSLVRMFKSVEPIVRGKVISKKSNKPIPNAAIRVIYADTTQDTSLSIPYSRYCNLITRIPGQYYSEHAFTTQTDSFGIFEFRLLPAGCVTIEAICSGFEKREVRSCLSEQTKTDIEVSLFESAPNNSEYEIVVYGKTNSDNSIINIKQQEYSTGMTHSLSEIIQSQSAIRRSSKSESAILVRSGSPNDNLYMISGVPFYAPFHFAGYSFGEIDGLMISVLSDINVIVNEIAGRYPSVSGTLIEANPGIFRPSNEKLISRPELVVDFGNRSVDLLLSYKSRNRKKRCLQVGFSGANFQLLKWLRFHYGLTSDAALGIGFPDNFGNVTLSAQSEGKRLVYNTFGWFAWDSYSPYDRSVTKMQIMPWGMMSCNFNPSNSDKWSFLFGGSHQYFADGKSVMRNSFLNTSYVTNGAATLKVNALQMGPMNANVEGQLEYKEWYGDVIQRNASGIKKELFREGEEIGAYLHGRCELNIRALSLRTNLLLSTKIFTNEPVTSFDPGFSLNWTARRLLVGIHIGKITSFPDFRGLPDENFRKKQLTTIVSSIPIKYQSRFFKIGVQPYLRMQNSVPRLDPLTLIWDTAKTTAFRALGLETNVELEPAKWITLHSNVNMADANRSIGENEYVYEWESSFSSKCGVHLHFFKDALHTYFDWHRRSGNYYYDFTTKNYQKLQTVNTHDLSVQIRYPNIRDRLVTRYDGYITFHNLFNKSAVRDYYWDRKMVKTPIVSDGIYLTFGLKAGFRF